MKGQKYEKVDVRIESARIACGILGRTKGDTEANERLSGLEQFKKAYEYIKKELEEALNQ